MQSRSDSLTQQLSLRSERGRTRCAAHKNLCRRGAPLLPTDNGAQGTVGNNDRCIRALAGAHRALCELHARTTRTCYRHARKTTEPQTRATGRPVTQQPQASVVAGGDSGAEESYRQPE